MAGTSGFFELVAFTDLAAADVFAAVDVSDTTQSPVGSTKKITAASVFAAAQPIAIAAGTVTVSTPVFQATETWNASGVVFTAIKLNVTDTASNTGSLLIDLQVGGTSMFKVDKAGNTTLPTGSTLAAQAVTATTVTTGLAFGGIAGGAQSGTTPVASYGANYYNTGAARVRPDTGKAGLMWEFDATDSVYLQYITAAGSASTPACITAAGAMTLASGLTVSAGNTSLQTLDVHQTLNAFALILGANGGNYDLTLAPGGSAGAISFYRSSASALWGQMSGGVFAWGTTVTTSASAGEQVMAYGNSIRSVNSGGTDTYRLIQGRTLGVADLVMLSADGKDIAWGAASAALGGGSAATLGTIGSTGPTVAAQNKWLRIRDSGGALYWFPVWA